MNKELVIVFVKNAKLGKVKTRLAKAIGDEAALKVYSDLLRITENTIRKLSTDVRVYFSNSIEDSSWKGFYKSIQNGKDLGERMLNAFKKEFADGYNRIVLIGSDLPDISEKHIHQALTDLKKNDAVFGPAEDGGYYLVGLSKMNDFFFEDKPWSQPQLLAETLKELQEKQVTFTTLDTLNDIDTFEDLVASKFYQNHYQLQEIIKELHD